MDTGIHNRTGSTIIPGALITYLFIFVLFVLFIQKDIKSKYLSGLLSPNKHNPKQFLSDGIWAYRRHVRLECQFDNFSKIVGRCRVIKGVAPVKPEITLNTTSFVNFEDHKHYLPNCPFHTVFSRWPRASFILEPLLPLTNCGLSKGGDTPGRFWDI